MTEHRQRSLWTPYGVAWGTFLLMLFVFTTVAEVFIDRAVKSGALPREPELGEYETALDVAFGSAANKLGWSVALNCLVILVVALVATRRQFGVRLRFSAPRVLDVVVGTLGLICMTSGLDSIVALLGLRDIGSLAGIREAISPLSGQARLAFAALIGFGPGFAEEVMFRGYLLNRMAGTHGQLGALLSSSILFGLFHADWVHTPLALCMGLYLGLCLLYTGSIWVPIAAHVGNNMLATIATEWVPSTLQAGLLVPLGVIGGVSALVFLRGGVRLSSRQPVW